MKEFIVWFWDSITEDVHRMSFRAENEESVRRHCKNVYEPKGLEFQGLAERSFTSS